MAASLRAAATRMLRPAVHPGEGLRRVFRTQQLSKFTTSLEEEPLSLAQQQREKLFLELKKSNHLPEEHRASLIKQIKEELYELIADAEANSVTSSLNRSLLKDLSTQIEPRPHDPQWCKITRTKKVTKFAAVAGILVINALSYGGLADRPELVEYDGHLVTVESLPLLRGFRPDATAEGVKKQDGYQPAATTEGVHKQDGYQPVATAEGVSKQDGYQPVATAEGMSKQYGYQPIPTAEGV